MTDKLKELLSYIHGKLTQREMPSEQALAEMADRIESALSAPAVEAAEIEVPTYQLHMNGRVTVIRDQSGKWVAELIAWELDALDAMLRSTRILAGVNLDFGLLKIAHEGLKAQLSSAESALEHAHSRLAGVNQQAGSGVLFSKGFTTLETGEGKYRIVISYQNRDHAWSDYMAINGAAPLPPSPAAKAVPNGN